MRKERYCSSQRSIARCRRSRGFFEIKRNSSESRPVAQSRVGRFLLSSWPVEMDVRMRIHRQGGVRGPSEGLRLAHYQQLWPNGTPRRATRLHRPPPTSATIGWTFTDPRDLPPPAVRQRNLIARSIIIFVTPRSPPWTPLPLLPSRFRAFPPPLSFPDFTFHIWTIFRRSLTITPISCLWQFWKFRGLIW